MKVTIKDLLKKSPKTINNDLDFLSGPYYNHLPEAFFGQDQNEAFPWWTFKTFDCIKNLVYVHKMEDCRRFHYLAIITFNDIPVMVYRAAGREGDDFNDRFITNRDVFNEMIMFIDSKFVLESKTNEGNYVVDIETHDVDMASFYFEDFNL
jgi:hypothetical protein